MARARGWFTFVFIAVCIPAAAQDVPATMGASADAVAAGPIRDLPMPDTALAERRAAPNPSDEQQRLMDELTEVSDATHARNQLEAAQRMAPVDLLFGLPADR